MKTSLTIRQATQAGISTLENVGIDTAQLDATVLLAYVLGKKREELLIDTSRTLNSDENSVYNQYIKRRAQHEPVAYILGTKEFWSLDFTVTRDTLIPRPDSETLVEVALKKAHRIANNHNRPLTLGDIGVLDIGTGTGCLLIALLSELPSAQGLGVDISESALAVAENNAKNHGVDNRVRFKKSNWHNEVDEQFDLVISNPPYIASGDVTSLMKDITQYEPAQALFSGADGMDSYRAIAQGITGKLRQGGYIVVEVGQGQAETVAEILEQNGLTIDDITQDLAGTPRCVSAVNKH
jgi:release factor glutamine methyltransferase